MFLISDAMAQATTATASGSDLMMQFVPLILIFVVFWFFLIRPQQKRQKEHQAMIAKLAKGDEVETIGGLAGVIMDVSEQYVKLQISKVQDQPVSITVARGAVSKVLPVGTITSI